MTQYAQYDPSVASPSPVIGWYDTDVFRYTNLPEAGHLVVATTDQWKSHFNNAFAVENGSTLVPYTTPAAVDTRVNAKALLAKSDTTVIRCAEHGVAVPQEWKDYRSALRAIVSGSSTTTQLPTEPVYPPGT